VVEVRPHKRVGGSVRYRQRGDIHALKLLGPSAGTADATARIEVVPKPRGRRRAGGRAQ
jgi:hypothetical protein